MCFVLTELKQSLTVISLLLLKRIHTNVNNIAAMDSSVRSYLATHVKTGKLLHGKVDSEQKRSEIRATQRDNCGTWIKNGWKKEETRSY
jgi:hypothetical protein